MSLEKTVAHLLNNVLPAASEYRAAEDALSRAYEEDKSPANWEAAGNHAKRKASELALAIDGLTDRVAEAMRLSKSEVRKRVTALCYWPGTMTIRQGSFERVRGVANAYKHHVLTDRSLPISSDEDVLAVGLGYGLDGFGVGKFGGVEVIVRETAGQSRKFLGDAPTVIAAWFRFLDGHGAAIGGGPYTAFGLQVYPLLA